MGGRKAVFLQMQPYLATNMKHVWNSMLVMSMFLFGIGLLQDIMNLLLEVLDWLNKFGCSIFLHLSLGAIN
jgi:hypothetical protein